MRPAHREKAMCSRFEVQSLLSEYKAQIGQLDASCCELREKQVSLKDCTRRLRQDVEDLQYANEAMRKEHKALREEHEALRDCLLRRKVVDRQDVCHEISLRRAPEVFRKVLETPELAAALGESTGVSTARRMREVSKLHAAAIGPAIRVLERKFPPEVYVFGGKNNTQLALATVERLNPRTMRWDSLPPMRSARYGCAAAALNGRLYVVGGHNGTEVVASVERFNPMRGVWERVPPMMTARSRCAASAARGLLYVIGGRGKSIRITAAERFDPVAWRWEELPPRVRDLDGQRRRNYSRRGARHRRRQ